MPRSKWGKSSSSNARLISIARSPRKLKKITLSWSYMGPTGRPSRSITNGGSATNLDFGGAEALAHFARVLPDVVIMDLRTPGMDSPVVTRLMKRVNPSSQIIALANEVDPNMERRVLLAGALCCVVKDSSAGALVEAIHKARGGECSGFSHTGSGGKGQGPDIITSNACVNASRGLQPGAC